MLFNEERSHLAADQSKTFLIASHIIMFGFPVLLLLLYGRNAVQHSSSFSFFLFPSSAIVQQAQRSADGERVVYTTKVAKRHSVGLIVVWYALSNEWKRERKRCGLEKFCIGEARIENGGITRLLRIRVEQSSKRSTTFRTVYWITI